MNDLAQRLFADHLEENVCQCLIPLKSGSRFYEVMDGIDLATYSFRPFNEENQQDGTSVQLFRLENMRRYKTGETKSVEFYANDFYLQVMGVDLKRIRTLEERAIYRPTPVLWHNIESLEMIQPNAPGEEDIVLREHNDSAFIIPSDIMDAEYYKESLKNQLRMSLIIRNCSFQEKMAGYFKLPSDEPRNEYVPENVDIRASNHDWAWIKSMNCSLGTFAKSLSEELKANSLGELKRQKKALSLFQKEMKLGDWKFYADRGEDATYLSLLHEYLQMMNMILCQSLTSLEFLLDKYSIQNEDFYKLLEQHIDR